jgi:hypothetical protein
LKREGTTADSLKRGKKKKGERRRRQQMNKHKNTGQEEAIGNEPVLKRRLLVALKKQRR